MAFDLVEELGRILAAFDELAVEYALGGWLASAIHRSPTFAARAEILVAEGGLLAALAAAATAGFVPPSKQVDRSDCQNSERVSKRDDETLYELTLDLRVAGDGLSSLWSRRVRASWRGREVTLVSREGLASGWPYEAPGRDTRLGIHLMTRQSASLDIAEEKVSRRLEEVRALYHLGRSLRSAKILGPATAP